MGLAEKFSMTPVADLNLREMPFVESSASVREVVQTLREADLGCALVVDDGEPAGLFTEGMLRESFAKNPGVVDEPITEHMASPFPKVYADDTADMVLAALETNNTRFICVVDRDEHVVGLTGQKGLMEFVAEEFPRQVMVQRVGEPSSTSQREGA